MSLTWRERLARARRRLMEELNLTESDFNHIQEKIGSYCRESDEQVHLVHGDHCNVDREVEKMTEGEFIEMTKEIIERVMASLGYIPEKKRKKKKVENKVEEKKEAETKTEEETANEIEEEEKEKEIIAQ